MLAGDIADLALGLASQMTERLAEQGSGSNPTFMADPDLIEWCRAARDVLARTGKLTEDDDGV